MDGFRSASFRDFGYSDQGFREDLRAAVAAAVAGGALVDFTIGFGSGGATLRSPNTVEASSGDAYKTTRNGLDFGVSLSSFSDQGVGALPGGSDGRFKTSIQASGNFSFYQFDIPNGTYRVRSAQGVDFTATATLGLRIYNTSGSAVLHSIAGSSALGNTAMDILGTDRAVATWDANAGFKDIVVTGGQGVLIDRFDQGQLFLNYIRFQQTA